MFATIKSLMFCPSLNLSWLARGQVKKQKKNTLFFFRGCSFPIPMSTGLANGYGLSRLRGSKTRGRFLWRSALRAIHRNRPRVLLPDFGVFSLCFGAHHYYIRRSKAMIFPIANRAVDRTTQILVFLAEFAYGRMRFSEISLQCFIALIQFDAYP